ncbi:glycine cleavage system aminomethyltransferase GcvT [Bacillus sp. HMF5848]|uniref:glycine cleavage system aminomethyltransferase GcvT n=1 Tax=Bacillus sp. HMF5848 TaxID=2495421 RepID=UPI000F79D7EC|nr:glycine cleavage system aminomethyltransferase GcvT [Bacillus sp. HMF5848]RSK27821.1 glycine cleavage system aminomethyltransferase GcvT [Bacillus sp. HMF5848]
MTNLRRTPLFDVYKKLGAKTIDFGGWELPVQFSSILEEHHAVRNNAGLFDVSHMGEIEVKGQDSLLFLQKIMTNDISKLVVNKAQYTAMCYEDGGTVDDLLVYKKADNHYLLVVNASNIDKDFSWIQQHVIGDVHVENISDDICQLALQGPRAEEILSELTTYPLQTMKPFTFVDALNVSGANALVSRTGYTGEDGFEIYCEKNDAVELWWGILEAGKDKGLLPCGLGCRDTLRFEANLALYGQELSREITPIEAGIGFAVKTNKDVLFIGQGVLAKQKEEGTARKIVGIEMIDKGIPRHGYNVYVGDQQIGVVTTGTQSPTLKKNVGLVLIADDYTAIDTLVEVEIRGRRLKAKVVATPFYKRAKK